MSDPLSIASTAVVVMQAGIIIFDAASSPLRRLVFYTRLYGYAGILLSLFGNNAVLKMQFEVLASENPQTALDFKNARQKESDTVAIAGSILAQIAITSLSLNNLSQAHWTARGFLVFSLVASVISVYFASSQQKALSRLLNPEDIRAWIRMKSLDSNVLLAYSGLPSVGAVLTVSAPNALLSMAVHGFLIGFGIYLGFVWTKGLDESSTSSGNRAIFITYIVSLSVCYSLYTLSNVAASGHRAERDVFQELVNKAQSDSTANGVPLRSMDASGRESVYQDHSPNIQHIFRESARLKRDLAVLDDRIAQLLGVE